MNIYEKIASVMEDVQYLCKDDTVDAGKGKSYRAITEEKVTSAVRASMLKNGLVMFPVSMHTSRDDETVDSQYGQKVNRITTVNVVYRMVNKDNPDEFIDIASSGTGVDTQDKGVGKAMTYAYKYALLRTFAIPTGEDPDKISSEVYSEKLIGTEPQQDSEMLLNIILALGRAKAGQNDSDPEGKEAEKRTRAFAETLAKANGWKETTLEKMTTTQLKAVKVALAKK